MAIFMTELFDRYEKECVPDLSERTQRDYRNILTILRKSFGHFEPDAIKPKHIVAFLDVPKGRIHRNRMVTILSTVYKKAIYRWCLLEDLRNPCEHIEKWPTKPRERYVTDAEFQAVRAIAPPQLQMGMDLALLTGQRQGDIVGLTWKQVRTIGKPRETWHLDIRQGKTGKHLGIFISPEIEKVLRRARVAEPQWPHEFVLRTNPPHGPKGNGYTPDGFRALWQRVMNQYVRNGGTRYNFHDLRAKAVSDNASLEDASALAGHLNMQITKKVYKRNIQMVQPLR